ncbi:MAG: hypothetical protein WKF71_03055 [Pyrinomonadaceae bacterium]
MSLTTKLNYFNYFSEIEETFIRRRGRNLLLSPLDWALIETWQERNVPLHIVLRAIEKVFDSVDKQPARKRTVKSLLYCREEIEAQYAEWLDAQTGKNGANGNGKIETDAQNTLVSTEALAAHLEKASAELEAATKKVNGELRTTLETIVKKMSELKSQSFEAESLESHLEKYDSLIDESLSKFVETERLKVEIEKQLASYKNKMERKVYQRTFDLMLLKRLREQLQIPRLSLFYL